MNGTVGNAMPDQWWLSIDGKPAGPYSRAYVALGLKKGRFAPESPACPVGGLEWKLLREWPEFRTAHASRPGEPAPTATSAKPQRAIRLKSPSPHRTSSLSLAKENLREIGMAQKWLICSVVASGVGLLSWPLQFVTIPFQIYCVVRLASACNQSNASMAVLAALMFVPLASTVALLVLNQTATRKLREAGIPVGFFGARNADLPA